MKNKNLERDLEKTRNVIISCHTPDQLRVGVKMYNRLTDIYDMSEEQINKLKNLIGLMRIKCNVDEINEGESAIDKTFHKYSQMSGVPELQQLRFNESEGVSKDMTPKDLADKHGVDEMTIKNEIKLGTKIEKEHTDSIEEAKRIAMDHIFEFSDYYSDPMFGIVAIEKYKDGHRKTIRISKKDMEKLHKDGSIVVNGIEVKFPISEDFNFNRAVRQNKRERKDELSKRLTKNDIFDKIDELKNNRYSELKSSEEEDIEEATSALGSGSYTGSLSSKINRRSFKKSDITNNIPTSVTGLPTGKMYSFNEEKEVLEENEKSGDNIFNVLLLLFLSSELKGIKPKHIPQYVAEVGGDLLIEFVKFMRNYGYVVDVDFLKTKWDSLIKRALGKYYKDGGVLYPMLDDNPEDLDEATSFGSVGGVYDTSGFPASEFMGTKGKKGKVPVKKKQPNGVLKKLGYQKVRVKEKCKKFPYCNQSPDAIEFYNESFVIKKTNLKLK